MGKTNVQVTISAVDKSAAAFKAAERNMDRLVMGAKKVGGALAGIFVVGRLGSFMKQSAQAAAEVDRESKKILDNLTKQFEDAQIAIGKAVLGNDGIKAALEVGADALKVFAAAIADPVGTVKDLFTDLWNSLRFTTGRVAALIGNLVSKLPGEGGQGGAMLRAWGDSLADDAVMGMAASGQGRGGLGGRIGRGSAPRGRPRGPSDGRKALDRLNQQLDMTVGTSTWLQAFDDDRLRVSVPLELIPPDPEYLTNFANELTDVIATDDSWAPVREALADGIMHSVVDGFAAGIEMAIATGSFGDGFKSLTGVMLQGLGSSLMAFGQASLAASIVIQKIKNSLMALNPVAGIAASIGLIAIGATLRGAAQRIFGSMGSTQAFGAAISGRNASLAGGPLDLGGETPVPIILPRDAYLKADDPTFQAFLVEAFRRAAGRNVVFRYA
jgi:hypothetical protein